jgi:predicted nucleic acid-binding protein
MSYLLDTCVLSESHKKSINENLKNWLVATPDDALFMSVISVGEIRNGIERLTDLKRKERLVFWLEHELAEWFEDRVLSLDYDILNCWGFLNAHCRTLPAIDSLLAATAIHRHLTLVTRNTRDFQGIEGLKILNPWEYDPISG